jgi:KAP family P-loop domain
VTAREVPVSARRAFSDSPIASDDDDVLGFGDYADALADLIDNLDTSTPLTIAISAPWGSGKTSLANLVVRRLRDWPVLNGDPEHVICWFRAWIHDDAPHLGASFAADVAKTVNAHRPLLRRTISPLPGAMLSAEERWHRRLLVAGIALLIALPSAFVPGLRDLFIEQGVGRGAAFGASLTSVAAVLTVVYLIWSRLFALAQKAASFVDDPKSEAAKGSMAEVREQLGKLIAQVTHRRRLVIFVDDLERCRPPRAVEVCEVATQLLDHPQVVTVLLADMRAIAAAAAIKYAALEGRYEPTGDGDEPAGDSFMSYGLSYLEKLVQLQFQIPVDRSLPRKILERELQA